MASSEIWAKRVAGWRASGRTAEEYAAGRGFAGSTLRWWASHLGRRTPAIVQVVRSTSARDAGIELAVGDVRVVVHTGFDRALLGEVLDVLREKATT